MASFLRRGASAAPESSAADGANGDFIDYTSRISQHKSDSESVHSRRSKKSSKSAKSKSNGRAAGGDKSRRRSVVASDSDEAPRRRQNGRRDEDEDAVSDEEEETPRRSKKPARAASQRSSGTARRPSRAAAKNDDESSEGELISYDRPTKGGKGQKNGKSSRAAAAAAGAKSDSRSESDDRSRNKRRSSVASAKKPSKKDRSASENDESDRPRGRRSSVGGAAVGRSMTPQPGDKAEDWGPDDTSQDELVDYSGSRPPSRAASRTRDSKARNSRAAKEESASDLEDPSDEDDRGTVRRAASTRSRGRASGAAVGAGAALAAGGAAAAYESKDWGPDETSQDELVDYGGSRPPSRAASRTRNSEKARADAPRPKGKRRSSIRSAKSFPAQAESQSESRGSDAEDPSGDDDYNRRPPSVRSDRSRKRRLAAEAGAAAGATAAAGEMARSRRGSTTSRNYVRKPMDSDDERRSLRSTRSRSSSIFDDRPVVDEDDASFTQEQKPSKPIVLTPVERHYLNKALLCLQMQREWSALSNIGELAMYGKPFLPHPTGPGSKPDAPQEEKASLFSSLPIIGGGSKKAAPSSSRRDDSDWDKPLDPPLLKYLFYRFIKNFPGLDRAKEEYWTDRIQPFFDSFAERNFSVTRERGELTKRRLLAMGFTRILGTYFGAAVTPLGDEAPSRPDGALMRRVDIMFPGSMQSMHRVLIGSKGQVNKATRYNAWCAIPAAGSTGDDKTYTIITRVLAAEDRPVFVVERSLDAFLSFSDKLEHFSENNMLNLPLVPFNEETQEIPHRLSLQRWLRTVVIMLSNPKDRYRDHPALTKARQQLERFLLDRPLKDSDRRKAELLDAARKDDEKLESEKTAWQAAGKRARELRTTWAMYRDALIGARELDKSWSLVSRFDRIKDLPRLHRDAVRWASLWVAYTLHYLYKTSPQAQDLFNLTKSFHGLIPYGLLKTGLRIANPTLMIKTVVNIVLGQPMGQPSLFQRIFGLVMGGQIKQRKKEVDTFRASIGNNRICDILESYVYAPRSTQEHVRQSSYEEDEDIIITILREGDLGETSVADVQDWRDAFEASGMTADDAFADNASRASGRRLNPEARKYLQLKGLLRALCLKRDREQVLEIVDEPNTPLLLKASISVFYNAIYEIAEAANLADRLGDLQAFLQDLVDTVDRGETETSDFIKLTERHEQSLYFFLHELFAYGGDLTDPLKAWSRSGLNLLKVGLPDKERGGRGDSRRLGADVDRLINKADAGTKEEILREIRGLAQWTRLRKVQNDIWLRCDLLATDEKSPLVVHAPDVVRQFTEEEREAVDYIESAHGAGEGGVAWAWFAESDILEGADIRSDWRSAANEAAGIGADKKGKKSKKKASQQASRGAPAATLEEGTILPPPPRLLATKTLVEPWTNSLKYSLASAKEKGIK